jgi:hypothetical protein
MDVRLVIFPDMMVIISKALSELRIARVLLV